MDFDILFRSCSRVAAFSGKPRFLKVPKQELVLRCLNSLILSIDRAVRSSTSAKIRLTVIDDRSDTDCVEKIRQLLNHAPVETAFHTFEGTGNAASLQANYKFARQHCRGLIYFVEDDYLHDRNAILELVESDRQLRKQLQRDIVLFPCDYPDRYRQPYPAHVLLGSHRHWRTVRQTTGTFVTPHSILERYWDNYMGFAQYGLRPGITENNTINLTYLDVPCFSPLPSLAVHLQYAHTLSPYVDWQKWWDEATIN